MFREKYMRIKPPPPSNLDSKSLSIWASWSTMSEKEVAREAVMKGTHIGLVKQFLSKKLDIDDSDAWFRNEINCWVLDLLLRKQTYRVTHILQNMGIDSFAEMLTIFLETCCKELRQNVGNHLLKHEKLSESLINNWYLLSAIESQPDILMPLTEKWISLNLKCINQQTDKWRNAIGTEIFFRTFNFDLKVFLNPFMAWTYLLKSNIDLLKYWINLHYNSDTTNISLNIPNLDKESLEKLNGIFIDWNINDELIATLTNDQNLVDQTIQVEILNELSKFGVFDRLTQNNLFEIVKRLLGANKIHSIEDTLSRKSANISLKCLHKLLVDYCETNDLFNILNVLYEDFIKYDKVENNSEAINLIVKSNFTCIDLNNIELLRNNIFDVAKFLSKSNVQDYFSSYPIILLSIIIFTKLINMEDLLIKGVTLKINDFEINKEILLNCFKDYHCFINFCHKFDNVHLKHETNHYKLLKKHTGINMYSACRYKFENTPLPTFNSVELIEKYGYKKNLDFVYFLKNCRPIYAYYYYKTNLTSETNEMDYVTVMDRVYRVALRNFKSIEITSSCVAFIEMLRENSYPLRLYLTTANIIYNSGKVTEIEILKLFENISGNCQEIFCLLEASIVDNIQLDANSSGDDLIDILKSYGIVVRFSALHKLQLPELFLKACAAKDLWLPFLIYVQIYNYPIEISSRLVQTFASKSIIEHMAHAILHDIHIDEVKNQLMGERDSRKYFLSKLGVRLTDSSGSNSDMSSHSSYGSMANSIGSDFLESETLDYQADLLEVLIKCHNSADPPRALLYASRHYRSPLLAVLANSYEPDSVIVNWVTWLEVSCDIDPSFINFDGIITPDSVLDMFRHIMMKNYFKTLTNSFCIFLKENPLSIIMEFLNEAVNHDFKPNLQEMLQNFKEKITFWRSNSYISEIDHDMSYFNNKLWIQNTAIFLICHTLQFGFRCYYDRILFLRFLNDINIAQYFLTQFPDIETFLKINEHLYDKQCAANFDLSVISNKNKYFSTITSYINELVQQELYEVALNLAQIMGISCDFILFKRLQNEFNKTEVRDETFWSDWDKVFQKYNIAPDAVTRCYLEYAQRVKEKVEAFVILKLTFCNWTNKHKLVDNISVEKEMWLTYFRLNNNSKLFEIVPNEKFNLLSEYSKELTAIPDCYNVLNEVELQNFEKVVEHMLNNGDITTALRLEKIFGYSTTDLDILKLCLNLVEGTVLPHELTARQRLLMNRRSNMKGSANIRRKTYTMPRISSCASVTSMSSSTLQLYLSDAIVTPTHDTLALLEMLMDNLKSGSNLASNIFKTYRISVNLRTRYQTILDCKDPNTMLRNALEEGCRNKLETVSDFVDIFKMTKEEIADLLYLEISAAIANYSISKMNICYLWDLNMDLDFNLALQLLPDNCSLLGFKLYYGCSNEFTTESMVRATELLIRSHDCFTADCNMEGISMVLKKCKSFTSMLEGMREYNLMVRLLTGIARYTEMTYIFHILKQQEQFELLLRRGSRKDGGLKIALLEYLKKYCPDDLELYKIVALHFFLFSEIAELWEQEAIRSIRRIVALAKLEMQNYRLNPETEPYVLLVNTEDNKKMLRKIMMKYSHASEYHLHGQKLTKAMTAAKQAQLVALQLSLFKDLNQGTTVTCILNLTNVQINKLVLSDFNFQQISIVIEAHNFEVNWSSILYEQYVVKDRADFFQNFAHSIPITEALVNEISRLFLSSQVITASMCNNMKKILNNLNSLHAKYRIASELGFTDVIEVLLNSQQLSYLKDTVWKSGYKNVDD